MQLVARKPAPAFGTHAAASAQEPRAHTPARLNLIVEEMPTFKNLGMQLSCHAFNGKIAVGMLKIAELGMFNNAVTF